MAQATNRYYPGTPGAPLYIGVAPPVSGEAITTFTLQNWNASASTKVLFRGGMPFKKGDVPAGMSLQVRRGGVVVAAQFDERSTWSDGSLKFCVCHMRDTDLEAMASRDYEIWSANESFDNSGSTSLSSVAAANALTVEFSSLAQWNGTTSATRGSGAALATLAAHSLVGTRVTKIHSGPVCEGWTVWGMAKDGADGSGAEDAHLKIEWHIDVWKNAEGEIIDVEHCPVITQDWWAVANKFRLDYTATYKHNGTTVQAYSGVQHPYHSRWATVRMQDDHNHAKRHWVGNVPTLTYKFDKAYWVATKLLPPWDTEYMPNSSAAATYAPLGIIGHRAFIDGTGAYMGRGVLPECDAVAFMRQGAFDVRVARTNAFAGLHVPYHFRDDRTRTRSGESADVANTLIPLLMLPKDASASTVAGLPEPKHAYRGPSSIIGYPGGYQAVSGGSGAWGISENASHAVPYSTYAYLIEGERYMLDSMIDLATAIAHIQNANQWSGVPYIHWYEQPYARAEMSIPDTRWSAIPSFTSQERALGLSANVISGPAALAPDTDPQGQYLRLWNAHCAEYLSEAVTYTPPSLAEAGVMYSAPVGSPQHRSPWMQAFVVQGCLHNYRMTESVGMKEYGAMVSRSIAALTTRSLYDTGQYHYFQSPIRAYYSDTNPFFTAEQFLVGAQATASSNVLTLDLPYYGIQNGDEIYFTTNNGKFLPDGYVEGTKLYAVSASGMTCSVAATPGGSPIAIPDLGGSSRYQIGGRFYGGSEITVASYPPYLPNPDSYFYIQQAAYVYVHDEGIEGVDSEKLDAVETFLTNVNTADDPRWRMRRVAP